MFRKNSAKKTNGSTPQPSEPASSPLTKLTFPSTRSRPTSLVDTTAIDTSLDSVLSSSPSSNHSFNASASPRKHTQSLVERLTNTQKKDAAASAQTLRPRTISSSSSKSSIKNESYQGSRSRVNSIPSLLKSTASLSPAQPSTSTTIMSPASHPDGPSTLSTKQQINTQNADAVFLERPNTSATDLLSQFGGDSLPHRRVSGQAASPLHQATIASTDISHISKTDSGNADNEHTKHGHKDESTTASNNTNNDIKGNNNVVLDVKKHPAPPLVALVSDPNLSQLIKQGAEAKVYISNIMTDNMLSWPQPSLPTLASQAVTAPSPILIKWRFPKTYRHPTLSSNITASRTIMEARALLRCAKAGVTVPAIRCVDEKEGILGLELISGKSVREWLGGGAEGEDKQPNNQAEEEEEEEILDHEDQVKLMKLIGRQLAKMHEADIIHGDLTTSNMLLKSRPGSQGENPKIDLDKDELVLIDFGLSLVSAFAEDKAVDLYVLERAFASTHPASEALFQTILDTYAEEIIKRSARSGKKATKGGKPNRWDETRKRLEEVRLRGRKRSMVGFSEMLEEFRSDRVAIGIQLSITFEWIGVRRTLNTSGRLLRGLLTGGFPTFNVPTHTSRRMSKHTTCPAANGNPLSGKFKEDLTSHDDWAKVTDQLDHGLDQVGTSRLIDSQPGPSSSSNTSTTDRDSYRHEIRSTVSDGITLPLFSLVPFQSIQIPKRIFLVSIATAEHTFVRSLEMVFDLLHSYISQTKIKVD